MARLLPPPSFAFVTAAGLAPVANVYEVVTSLEDPCVAGPTLRNFDPTTFTTARAIAAADSEFGWTWANRVALAADENTTVADCCYFDHGNTSTNWISGTTTCPFRYRIWNALGGRMLEVVARVRSAGATNFDQLGILICSDTTLGSYMRTSVGAATGDKVAADSAGTGNSVAITADERTNNGSWVRLVTNGRDIAAYYNLTDTAVRPSTWTPLRSAAGHFDPGHNLRVGMYCLTANTANTLTGNLRAFQIREYLRDPWRPDTPLWSAAQFPTTSPGATQTLLADSLIGGGCTINVALLRLILPGLVNQVPGETATVEFSAKISATTGATPTTWNAASAVVLDGTSGPYLSLWCRITSDGTTRGSVRLQFQVPLQAA